MSLKTNASTTPINVRIHGIKVHWIGDIWRLHEQEVSVEESGASHQDAVLAKVVGGVQPPSPPRHDTMVMN